MRNHVVLTVAKGLIVGGTMLVPGVSGGTMAMILGIYDRLVTSVSSFMKHKRQSLFFLALFSAGGLAGMLLFANPLLALIEAYPMPTLYFFLGAVAGGIPVILKQARIERFSWKVPLYTILGLLAILLFTKLPMGTFQAEADRGFVQILFLAAVGFIAAVGLVLPGISVSYLLLLMGQYDVTMKAISDFDLPILMPFGRWTAHRHRSHYKSLRTGDETLSSDHLSDNLWICSRFYRGSISGGSGRVDAASVPGTAGGRILPDPSVVAAGDEGMKGDQMNFVIRIATEKDIDELEVLYDALNDHLAAGVNYPGWLKGIYPVRETAAQGIAEGCLYVAECDHRTIGSIIFAARHGTDLSKARWQLQLEGGSGAGGVHLCRTSRLAVKGNRPGALDFAVEYGLQTETKALRLDVYEHNLPAIHLYKKRIQIY